MINFFTISTLIRFPSLQTTPDNLYLFLFYGILVILVLRLVILCSLSFYFIYKVIKKKEKYDFLKISIIIPAYNEEISISSCINSMLNLNYPSYEVIVVDDGSSDNTFIKASEFNDKGVKTIRQDNTGKPGAINTGIKSASGKIVLTVDADSKLHPDALKWISRRFSKNHRLGAVAGNVKIDKPEGLMKILQSLEYTTYPLQNAWF
jgi:cellulose synthase/poly-beta-1,6-N-acetylglucosamine synthase-like glycosyltransferase